jgi:hypothetical protein
MLATGDRRSRHMRSRKEEQTGGGAAEEQMGGVDGG